MKAAVTGLPIVMAESSEVVSMAVLNHSLSDSSELNTKVSFLLGVYLLLLLLQELRADHLVVESGDQKN